MRILWNSSTPLGVSGYGTCTRELVRRLVKEGHFVRIATKHGYFGWHEWEGIEVYDGTNVKHNNKMLDEEEFDYVFSHWDIWVLNDKQRYPKEKWVGYIPVDTEWISDGLKKVALDVGFPIALSRHGKRELEAAGLKDVAYAPHGVDTNIFKPDPKARKLFRDHFKWDDDTFIIGCVGLNYIDDRKGFIPLFRAFKDFHEQYPNSRLYIHAHAKGTYDKTVNHIKVVENLGITEWVAWPPQDAYDLRRIDDDWLNEIYNGFDVFCLPTSGEGFGLPLIEAQASGIPVITTHTTTGPELVGKTGWLIDVDDDRLRWLLNGTWRYEPSPSRILNCLEGAYNCWKHGGWQRIKDDVREFALQYDWDVIWQKYWKPVLRVLEKNLVDRPRVKYIDVAGE